jgi:hypothetical protein
MQLSKYLKYNGIPLIDMQVDFHKNCAKFFASNGFLTNKQIAALKAHVHSAKSIERILKTKTYS